MAELQVHASRPASATRLRRVEGHFCRVIAMVGERRTCLDLAPELHAVEHAMAEAKLAPNQDHIDHCVKTDGAHDQTEIKPQTKLP